VFRFRAYGSLPVAPGEPYGEADVLELAHDAALVVLCGLTVLQGLALLVLGRLELRRLGALLRLFGVALPFAHRLLRGWVAAPAAG
jgi:hypothetical protein